MTPGDIQTRDKSVFFHNAWLTTEPCVIMGGLNIPIRICTHSACKQNSSQDKWQYYLTCNLHNNNLPVKIIKRIWTEKNARDQQLISINKSVNGFTLYQSSESRLRHNHIPYLYPTPNETIFTRDAL